MDKYQLIWNKYEQVYLPPETSIVCPWIYGMRMPISRYSKPLEEKVLILDEIPAPDFEAMLNQKDE